MTCGLARAALPVEGDGEVAVDLGIVGHRAEGPPKSLHPVRLVSRADQHHPEIGPRFGAAWIVRGGFTEGRGRRVDFTLAGRGETALDQHGRPLA